jgi:hypothetical protein
VHDLADAVLALILSSTVAFTRLDATACRTVRAQEEEIHYDVRFLSDEMVRILRRSPAVRRRISSCGWTRTSRARPASR